MSRILNELLVSDTVRRLNPELWPDGPATLPIKTDEITPPQGTGGGEKRAGAANTGVCEADLQASCEKWLVERGYGRRTPKKMQTHHTGKWFIHLQEAKGNPILLDLIVLDSMRGAYIEIELKVEGGIVSPDQNALIFRGEGFLAYTLEEFTDIVLRWEQQDGKEETVVQVPPSGLAGGCSPETVQPRSERATD